MAAKQDYVSIPTHIDGVELRVTTGTEVKLPRDVIELFYQLAVAYYKAKLLIERTSATQKARRKELISYAEGIAGLRGLRSEPDDCDLLVVRKETISYDPVIMKLAMGVAYQAYFTEELVATITIPLSLVTEEQVRLGLMKLLQELGVPAGDVDMLLRTELQLRVDEEKVEQLLADGRLALPEGARTVEVDWAVEAEQLRKPKTMKGPATVGKKGQKPKSARG